MPEHIDRLIEATSVIPAVNQIELHPYFQQRAVVDADDRHGILTQAWSPIEGITAYRSGGPSAFDDPVLAEIGDAHGKTRAQVMLRWQLQAGRSAIPKSVHAGRIAENEPIYWETAVWAASSVEATDACKAINPAWVAAMYAPPLPTGMWRCFEPPPPSP